MFYVIEKKKKKKDSTFYIIYFDPMIKSTRGAVDPTSGSGVGAHH
jgi:hypothetical protein